MGTQRCPVGTDRTDLATPTTYRRSRSSVAGHASRAQRNLVGVGHRCAVARAAQEISAVPDLPPPLPAMGCGRANWKASCAYWPRSCTPEENLQLEEAFIDASFTGAKKGGARCKTHFLGVWDTVSSVGWVYNAVDFPFTTKNPDFNIVRHAVSIDE